MSAEPRVALLAPPALLGPPAVAAAAGVASCATGSAGEAHDRSSSSGAHICQGKMRAGCCTLWVQQVACSAGTPRGGLLKQRTYTQKGMHRAGQRTRKQPAFSGCTLAYKRVSMSPKPVCCCAYPQTVFLKVRSTSSATPEHFHISGQYCSLRCPVMSYGVLCSCPVALTAHHSSCCIAAHAGKQCACKAHPCHTLQSPQAPTYLQSAPSRLFLVLLLLLLRCQQQYHTQESLRHPPCWPRPGEHDNRTAVWHVDLTIN